LFAFCRTFILFYPHSDGATPPTASIRNALLSLDLQNVEATAIVTTTQTVQAASSGNGLSFITPDNTEQLWLPYQNPTAGSDYFITRVTGTAHA